MATIADVARLAGVTKATVSYVINNKGTVSEKTRRKVEEAIGMLDYQPNLLARGLSDGRTRILALVINSITNPFYAEFAEEVQLAARQRGYYLLLYNAGQPESNTFQPALAQLYSLIDGLLVTKAAVPNADVQRASLHGIPVVLCLGWTGDEQAGHFPLVYYDHFQAAGIAAEHLLQLGHERVAVVVPEGHHVQRVEGFMSVFRESGAAIPPYIQYCSDDTIQAGYEAAQNILVQPERPTAIFATNDLLAIGVIDAIVDSGLRVPKDISVVGFDDITLASQVRPSLTSVALPRKALAVTALDLLLSHLDNGSKKQDPQQVELTPYLVVRQSTAPPGE